MTPTDRTLHLPPAGALALITALGVLEDQQMVGDVATYLALSNRLNAMFSPEEWARMSDDDERPVGLSMVEAALVLRALSVTETMSVEFEWYPAVIDTVRFIGDTLTALWTDDEWLRWRDTDGSAGTAGRR